ncbi:ETX/MTX2 family pore-forming toxin [Hahella ganghwensis]|uniref:ETX/MTX2 family pore-forming toxin n=1 Tax=Hahella ganghwensis TaxID=286420 RepID=UPI00036CF8E7|nr:ETX/MTX2 family pore-forming toxin [Hahella ganghwensis]
MKRLAIFVFLALGASQAFASDLLDYYFDINYRSDIVYGKTSKGSDFDMCDNYKNKRRPGDKITAITTYSGDERIKGIKIEYLYADTETVGSTGGSGYRKVLGHTEYVQKFRFYKKRDGNISRILLTAKDMTDSSTRELYFGKGNGWYKWYENVIGYSHRSLVGFAGTAGDSKIWSIYPCAGNRLTLEEVGVEIHWDQISESSDDQKVFFGERLLTNNSTIEQSDNTKVLYSYGSRESDSWTDTLGVSVTAGVSLTQGFKAGVPSTLETSGSITYSFSETFSASTTVGYTEEVNEQRTIDEWMAAYVPAHTVMVARMSLEYGEVSVPYTSTVRNPHDGKQFKFKGVISGSDYSNARKRWDEVGKVYGDRYEIYRSNAWVIDYYGLENATLIDDPDWMDSMSIVEGPM